MPPFPAVKKSKLQDHDRRSARRRQGRRGIVLISALFAVLLLAGIAALLGAQAQAHLRVFARLERVQYTALAEEAVQARLRAILGDLLTGAAPADPAMNLAGAPFIMRQSGQDFTVTLNGVAGLVDLYLAPPNVLGLLDGIAPIDPAARAAMIAGLPQGERYPSSLATLAHLGLDSTARRQAAPFVTQRSDGWLLHRPHIPAALAPGLAGLHPTAFGAPPSQRVMVRIVAP